MSGGSKKKKTKKGQQRGKARAPRILAESQRKSIMEALVQDDSQAMLSALGMKNPLLQAFPLPDGRAYSIIYICAGLGAWKCMLELLADEDRFRIWQLDLDPDTIAWIDGETLDWSEIVLAAVMRGEAAAIKVHRRLLYRILKELSPQQRQAILAMDPGDEHMAHAMSQLVAEEERALMIDNEGIRAPAPKANSKKDTGGLY
jgi:hypothetical protein